MSDGGYWFESDENPFNRMDYTRGGGGYDNSSTQASNSAREYAMKGSGDRALPRFANATEAAKAIRNGHVSSRGGISQVVINGKVVTIKNTTPAKPKPKPASGGPGKPAVKAPATGPNGKPVPMEQGGSGPATPNPRTEGPKGAGPGNTVTGVLGGGGAGNGAVFTGPFTPKLKTGITEFRVGGITMHPDPMTSNADAVEERWGDAEFLSPAWFTIWGIAGIDVVHNVNKARNEAGQQMMSTIDKTVKDFLSSGPTGPVDRKPEDPFMDVRPLYFP